MDILCALIGVNNLEVLRMSHDRVLIRNAIASKHVSRLSRRVQRFQTGISFQQRNERRCQFALVPEAAGLQASLQPE